MQPTCLAFDFDYTLASFSSDREGFFEIFTRQGASLVEVNRLYEQLKSSGKSSVNNLLAQLMEETDTLFDVDRVYREHDAWLKQNLKLYPDAEVLRTKLPLPVAIITHGDEQYQTLKIQKTGILFDHLFLTQALASKHEPLRQLYNLLGGPIVFVDDKAEELDAVRDAGFTSDQIFTHHIIRPDSRYGHVKPKFEHLVIETLENFI